MKNYFYNLWKEVQSITQNSGTNKFISGDNGIGDITNNFINNFMDYIKPFLEPVQVSYSNEVLANQIYGLSIALYILSLSILVLLIYLILNMIIFTYSDMIVNYFSNKYIKWYVSINKKFIGVELFILGSSLLYFMYILTYGLHFLATHPIDIDKNKKVFNSTKKILYESHEEVSKLDISDYFIALYNKYNEFLDSLTPDKIVCVLNIIMDGLIFSSFFTVLTIMLSENIIKKIVWLEKYPRILRLLQLRNNINKKVSKIYLLIHVFIIILAILGNIYMFFI